MAEKRLWHLLLCILFLRRFRHRQNRPRLWLKDITLNYCHPRAPSAAVPFAARKRNGRDRAPRIVPTVGRSCRWKNRKMNPLVIIAAVVVAVVLLGWLGLQIRPKPFPNHAERTPGLKTLPLPDGLPAPVERYYKTIYGNEVPVIETVVIKGRAVMSPFGFKMPARFIFIHNAGKDYRHYIETTWFGLPVMKVNESYVNGESYFELPIATYENDPNINQGANLAVWAEAVWFPSIWITNPRVRWEFVDDNTALMFVPFGDREENFVIRFNPETFLLDSMEAMRYRDSGAGAKKILWITRLIDGKNINGTKLSAIGSATWMDQGKPWVVFTLEDVVYNVDVSRYILQRGP
jgi:hypothetical protein